MALMAGDGDAGFAGRAVDAAIKIGLVALLAVWCLEIVRPFMLPLIWGAIIAIASYPGFVRLERRLGGKAASRGDPLDDHRPDPRPGADRHAGGRAGRQCAEPRRALACGGSARAGTARCHRHLAVCRRAGASLLGARIDQPRRGAGADRDPDQGAERRAADRDRERRPRHAAVRDRGDHRRRAAAAGRRWGAGCARRGDAPGRRARPGPRHAGRGHGPQRRTRRARHGHDPGAARRHRPRRRRRPGGRPARLPLPDPLHGADRARTRA